jgi:hypothetical protein
MATGNPVFDFGRLDPARYRQDGPNDMTTAVGMGALSATIQEFAAIARRKALRPDENGLTPQHLETFRNLVTHYNAWKVAKHLVWEFRIPQYAITTITAQP